MEYKYKISKRPPGQAYTINGVKYLMETLCQTCKRDLGEHAHSSCFNGNGFFVPMIAYPKQIELPAGV